MNVVQLVQVYVIIIEFKMLCMLHAEIPLYCVGIKYKYRLRDASGSLALAFEINMIYGCLCVCVCVCVFVITFFIAHSEWMYIFLRSDTTRR